MSESTSKVVEIQEVAAEDMKVILDFIYGVLDTLPQDRLQALICATDRLQVLYANLDSCMALKGKTLKMP